MSLLLILLSPHNQHTHKAETRRGMLSLSTTPDLSTEMALLTTKGTLYISSECQKWRKKETSVTPDLCILDNQACTKHVKPNSPLCAAGDRFLSQVIVHSWYLSPRLNFLAFPTFFFQLKNFYSSLKIQLKHCPFYKAFLHPAKNRPLLPWAPHGSRRRFSSPCLPYIFVSKPVSLLNCERFKAILWHMVDTELMITERMGKAGTLTTDPRFK